MSAATATLPRTARPRRVVRWPGWYKFLRLELAPLPNRGNMTLRLVVVNVIITLLTMTLRVPGLNVTAYVATLLTKDNQSSTTKTCVAIALGVSVACVISLFAYHFTLDYPAARLAFMAGMIYLGMWLMRASTLGFLGWAMAFFAALIQGNADAAPMPEQIVRGTLWFGVYFLYPVAVVLFVNRVLMPARPHEELSRGLRARLDLTIETLACFAREGVAGGRDDLATKASASRGVTAALGMLVQAEAQHPELKERHDALTASVVAGTRMARAIGNLAGHERVTLTEHDRQCVDATLAECQRLRRAIDTPHTVPSEQEIVGFAQLATLPELAEVQSAVTALRVSLNLVEPPDAEPPPAKKGFFKPDAFTNADYSHYALKTTLATLICYVLYTAIQWPGLSTALFTCTVITFEGHNEGSVHKALLRIGGCCAGGLIGFLAVTFLYPYMTSIGSLVLLSAAVTAFGGWIASGAENTAYFGGQLVYAFYICIDQKYAPNIDYEDIRNRVFGILLGLIVSGWIYANLWPQRAFERVRPALAKVLRDLAQLILLPPPETPPAERRQAALKLRRALPAAIDSTLRLAELSEGESDDDHPASRRMPLGELPDLVGQAQAIFLLANMLATRQELTVWEGLPAPAQAAEQRLRQGIADQLFATADLVETGRGAGQTELADALNAWREQAAATTPDAHLRMLERLADRSQRLPGLQAI